MCCIAPGAFVRRSTVYFSHFDRLVHDRELQLFDGTRLIGKEKYDEIKSELSLTDEQMAERYVVMFYNTVR